MDQYKSTEVGKGSLLFSDRKVNGKKFKSIETEDNHAYSCKLQESKDNDKFA